MECDGGLCSSRCDFYPINSPFTAKGFTSLDHCVYLVIIPLSLP